MSGVRRSPEVYDEICKRIANGETLRSICRDAHMPNRTMVYEWIKEDEDFGRHFARARDIGFDEIAEEALEIVDEPLTSGDPEVKHSDLVQHRKLRMEARLKLLAKWSPAKYGDRTSGDDGGASGGSQIGDTERLAKIAAFVVAAQAAQSKA